MEKKNLGRSITQRVGEKKRSRGKAGIPWDRLRTKDLTESLKWERSEWEKEEEEEVKEARKEVGGGGRARGR